MFEKRKKRKCEGNEGIITKCNDENVKGDVEDEADFSRTIRNRNQNG